MRWGSIGVVVGLCMVIAVWLRVVAKWGGGWLDCVVSVRLAVMG